MASHAVAPVVFAGPSQAPQAGGSGYRGAGHPGYGAQANYGNRVESRTCLICKQVGHLFRFCPNKASAAAALGAAPQ